MAPPAHASSGITTQFVGLLGTLSTFDPKYSSFSVFNERLKQFFIANNITDDERKRAILLNTLSEDCYILVRNLCVPELPESKSLDELCQLLKEHFSPVKSYFAERLKFYNCKRESSESVADWEAKVKSLASNCGFGVELSTIMRDIFVTGMNDEKIMDRLFEEDASKVSFKQVVKIALSKESSLREHESRGNLGIAVKSEPLHFQNSRLQRSQQKGRESGSPAFSGSSSNQIRYQNAAGGTNIQPKNRAEGVSEHVIPYWDQPFSQPYFDNTTRREYTTTVGQTAHLHCRVRNLGDRAVSWIRKRDLHILTVGILTYTNDQRFQSLHTDGSDEWTLKVTSPQTRDSGIYECQVSTEPKISQAFKLNVVVSKAKIIGNPELHIKSGSDINLTCVVLQTPDPPSFIYWYRGGNVINYSQRGGISVVTEKQTRTSRLLISRATPEDSGNYTCSPSSSDAASVLVHVLQGETPAAMQHSMAMRWTIDFTLLILLLCFVFVR